MAMKKSLLLLALCLPFNVYADDDTIETCMDANYSRILIASHKIKKNTLEIMLNVDNPSNVTLETRTLKNALEVRLFGTYMAREQVIVGKYAVLKDMGGWTQLIIKTGKNYKLCNME